MDGGLRDRGVGRDDRAASAARCADDRTAAGGGAHVVDFAVFAVSALAGWGPLGNCSRTVDGGVVSAAWPNVTNTGQQPRAEKHEFVTSWSAVSVDRTVRWLKTTASTINDLVDNRGSFPLFAELLFSARTAINQRRTLQMAAVGSSFIAFRARPTGASIGLTVASPSGRCTRSSSALSGLSGPARGAECCVLGLTPVCSSSLRRRTASVSPARRSRNSLRWREACDACDS